MSCKFVLARFSSYTHPATLGFVRRTDVHITLFLYRPIYQKADSSFAKVRPVVGSELPCQLDKQPFLADLDALTALHRILGIRARAEVDESRSFRNAVLVIEQACLVRTLRLLLESSQKILLGGVSVEVDHVH